MHRRRLLAYYLLLYAALALLHASLLRLPYFWDEAGYYVPAARDFYLQHQLIPTSTISNAHPPLPSLYLACWWWAIGYAPLVTRLAMLAVAAAALLAVFVFSTRLQNETVAWATVACVALYPVWFAQSSLAHADLLAACFVLWGFSAYVRERLPFAALLFAVAALSKETAILFPLGLFVWAVLQKTVPRVRRFGNTGSLRRHGWLLLAVVPLALWYAFHWFRTGYVFGNPEFLRYNVAETHTPGRVAIALLHRAWHLFGHMNLFVLTVLAVVAMFTAGLPGRERIAIKWQLVIAWLVLLNWLAYAVVGGALLTRYLLPCYPLIILLLVSTLWRRWKWWAAAVAVVLLAFALALVKDPRYRFAPEDNLAYADYVSLHQSAAAYIAEHLPRSIVLTAWPATDELQRPWLGYVSTPVQTVGINDFSAEQVLEAAQESGAYDAAFVFSTKYDPGPGLLERLPFWETRDQRYFGFHEDLPPATIARLLGGEVVWQQRRGPLWAAVIVFPRAMVG